MAIYARDLRLAARRRIDALLPVTFFVVAAALFPLGVGPEPRLLREMGPGVVWVCALLAAMLSVTTLFATDHADGSLEQMLLCGDGSVAVAVAKVAAHWTLTGLPLVLCGPLFGVLFDLHGDAIVALTISLALGTPILSLLGAFGSALTLGLRNASVLVIVLVVPLSIPALVFGTGAVSAVEAGQSPGAHYSILGALLILTAAGAPFAIGSALRIALE